MRKCNISLIIGVAWIAFWVGASISEVGKPPEMTKVSEWYFPFVVAAVFSFPFVLGYFAGRNDND